MLSWLWTAITTSKVAQIAIAIVVALGAALGFAAAQRAKGRAQERQAQQEQAIENRKTVDQISREVEGLGDPELDQRGERWTRR